MSEPTSVRGSIARWGLNGFAAFGLLYLFLPIIWIVVFSFNQPRGKFNFVWQEATLDNWRDPLKDEGLTDALVESLRIAAISTVIATILGSLIAIGLVRYRFKGNVFLDFLLILPLTTPEVVIGSSLRAQFLDLEVFGRQIEFGVWTLVISHVMFQISFVALTVRARLRGFNWSLEDAAQDLGASPLRTFWTVTFPLILPGILAAALLSFALSIDDFIISVFNNGSVNTFPLFVNASFKNSFSPQINVLATILLVVSVALMMSGALASRLRRNPK
ncbi:MAG: ABC transporter permease [Ilumatobacter sp.]|uniref:ABC transporter permease n=1 Tax=Ilumatobacter sp. TaxID=1967498 RepID=UPI00391C8AD7